MRVNFATCRNYSDTRFMFRRVQCVSLGRKHAQNGRGRETARAVLLFEVQDKVNEEDVLQNGLECATLQHRVVA